MPAGSLFVPIAQPRAPLVLHLLEPLAPDSLVAWGFFNASFERKEYMEAYVAEEEARSMLAADPALRIEFDARLRDPAFAKDAKARLDFFYKRHPSWDERVNLVPVFPRRRAAVTGLSFVSSASPALRLWSNVREPHRPHIIRWIPASLRRRAGRGRPARVARSAPLSHARHDMSAGVRQR